MAEMDPVAIAQSGVDPVTGSPLSSEVRKALFRRTIVPSKVFGRGGALVKRNESALVSQRQVNALESIVPLQNQIISLRNESALAIQQQVNAQESISFLQNQINNLRLEVAGLTAGLTTIARLIQADSVVEQTQIRTEQETERRNTERQIRSGRENLLEQKITSALVTPIAKLQEKISDTFGGVFNAIKILFVGWLTNQGIETLKAFTEGNGKKLEEIKNAVIKNLAIAAGGLFLINGGFGLILRTIIGITSRISRLTISLIKAPFKLAGAGAAALAAKLAGKQNVSAPPAVRPPVNITGSGGKVLSTRGTNFFTQSLKNLNNFGKGAAGFLRGAGNVASKVFTPLAIGMGTYRIATGDPLGGLLSYGSAIPGIGLGFAGLDVAREFGFGKGTFFGKREENPTVKVNPSAATTPTPEATAAPPMFGVDLQNTLKMFSDLGNQSTNNPPTPSTASSPAQVQTPQRQNLNIGTLPEPQPTVVVASTSSGNQSARNTATSGALTDIPLIPSSNPDNFYTLYSQMCYNVVT